MYRAPIEQFQSRFASLTTIQNTTFNFLSVFIYIAALENHIVGSKTAVRWLSEQSTQLRTYSVYILRTHTLDALAETQQLIAATPARLHRASDL